MMTIGEFSNAVGLSVKTIRHYQDKGLLVPARTDPFSGYRYYDERSLARGRTIVQLRAFEFSLSDIREILEHHQGEAGLVESLVRQREVIQQKLAKYSELIRSLDDRIKHGKEMLMLAEMFKLDRDVDRRIGDWLAWVGSDTRPDWGADAHNVTISSSWGMAGGDALAVVLGKQIGFGVWDRELIAAIATDEAHSAAIAATLDEEQRRGVAAQVDEAVLPAARETNGEALALVRVSATLAAHGRAILLEMGANYLLPGAQALHVRLTPTRDTAITHHAAKHEGTPEEALAELTANGEALDAFVRATFGRDLTDPGDYDIVLNSASLNLFAAVRLCVEAYERKFSPGPGWWYA